MVERRAFPASLASIAYVKYTYASATTRSVHPIPSGEPKTMAHRFDRMTVSGSATLCYHRVPLSSTERTFPGSGGPGIRSSLSGGSYPPVRCIVQKSYRAVNPPSGSRFGTFSVALARTAAFHDPPQSEVASLRAHSSLMVISRSSGS